MYLSLLRFKLFKMKMNWLLTLDMVIKRMDWLRGPISRDKYMMRVKEGELLFIDLFNLSLSTQIKMNRVHGLHKINA